MKIFYESPREVARLLEASATRGAPVEKEMPR